MDHRSLYYEYLLKWGNIVYNQVNDEEKTVTSYYSGSVGLNEQSPYTSILDKLKADKKKVLMAYFTFLDANSGLLIDKIYQNQFYLGLADTLLGDKPLSPDKRILKTFSILRSAFGALYKVTPTQEFLEYVKVEKADIIKSAQEYSDFGGGKRHRVAPGSYRHLNAYECDWDDDFIKFPNEIANMLK